MVLPFANPAAAKELVTEANLNVVPANSTPGASLRITALPAAWYPQEEMADPISVYAFALDGISPTIPGPFLRLRVGEEITLTFTNRVPPGEAIGLPPPNRRWEGMTTATGATLVVRGLERAFGLSPISIPYGESVTVTAVAREAGDFFYWGSTTKRPLRSRTGPEAQLTGLVVIDDADEVRDPDERFFVITMTDGYPELGGSPQFSDMFELAINGRSWPKTERLTYAPGETVHWRWINGSGFEHPMHLHGFHFRLTEVGDASGRHIPKDDAQRDIVTQLMLPGTSFRMEYVAKREGNWLIHCHIRDHVAGEPDPHGHHNAAEHALRAMDGLVMGITVTEAEVAEKDGEPIEHLRFIAREQASERENPYQGYQLYGPGQVSSDFGAPGPPIILYRGQTTRITIENQLAEPTNLHWHGLELQSKYDGVSGWSRTRDKVAPLIEPGGAFDVCLKPPRAGSYMYHTHMDATQQLLNGMYGPLIVLEPDMRFDAEHDRIILLGYAIDGKRRGISINGRKSPPPMKLAKGETYRLRFLNMSEGDLLYPTLEFEGQAVNWTAWAKDGADLPPAEQNEVPARFLFNAGETYDFMFTPSVAGEYSLSIQWDYPTEVGGETLHQRILVE